MLHALGTYSHLCASTVAEKALGRPLKRWRGLVRGRGGEAVGAVDVEPDVVAAYVGQGVDVVDRAGQRRACGGDDRDRGDAVSFVVLDRFRACGDVHASVAVDRNRADVPAADTEDLGGAADRVVRLGRAVERHLAAARAFVADARHGALARCGERGQVGDRSAGCQQPAGIVVEADELPDPPDRLRFEQVGGAGAVRDVDVVRGHQRVGQHADLETRGTDVSEPPRAGLGERAVEHVGGLVERRVGVRWRGREGAGQQLVRVLVRERLARTRVVEAPPRFVDQLGGVLEHVLAIGKLEGRSFGGRRRVARGCHRAPA